jgi:hypothetical protein
MQTRSARSLLALIVFAHAAVTVLHGAAHAGAGVFLGPAGTAFVLLVIEAGPLAGLWLSRTHAAAGGWLIATTMAAALVFGAVNHFAIPSGDHVAHVAVEWRTLFTTTAVLLVVTETIGTGAGAWYALGRKEWSS